MSPHRTALEDHILQSGKDIKAMVSQWYHRKPREFFGEEMLTYLHWEVPKNDSPFFGTFTVPLPPSTLGISARYTLHHASLCTAATCATAREMLIHHKYSLREE
jgi:hypothetical protein